MVQTAQSVPDFARELEGFQLGSRQPVFELPDAALGKGEAVNNAADQQEEGGNQNPETKAERRFHVHTSTPRRRCTIPRQALRLQTAQVSCRK